MATFLSLALVLSIVLLILAAVYLLPIMVRNYPTPAGEFLSGIILISPFIGFVASLIFEDWLWLAVGFCVCLFSVLLLTEADERADELSEQPVLGTLPVGEGRELIVFYDIEDTGMRCATELENEDILEIRELWQWYEGRHELWAEYTEKAQKLAARLSAKYGHTYVLC